MGKPLRRARAAPSARFGFLIRVRQHAIFQGRRCGQDTGPQRWKRKTRSGCSVEETSSYALRQQKSLSGLPLIRSPMSSIRSTAAKLRIEVPLQRVLEGLQSDERAQLNSRASDTTIC
jgi:hypothetical protein